MAIIPVVLKRAPIPKALHPHGTEFVKTVEKKKLPLWAIILIAVVLGLVLILTLYYIITATRARRKNGTSTKDIKQAIASDEKRKYLHQRSLSGISEDDPDNIKPVKRLRSFHMKGAASPDVVSPRTPKEGNSLFGRFLRKKDATGVSRKLSLDEERSRSSYDSLNRYPETPGLDEKILEASPPPTPQPNFGWNSQAAADAKRRSVPEADLGEQRLGANHPPVGNTEKDSFLAARQNRMSVEYNENYQSRPSGGYFDESSDDEERRPLGYNPDSRSGH